jgi:midasin (ATPase involved in ribosome maturation)
MFFKIAALTMSMQGNPPSEQGSGDRRSSPRIAAKDKEKEKANVPWKERKKKLRLPTDLNLDNQTTDVGRRDDAGGNDDVDSANEANREKRRIQPPAMW